MIEPRPAVAQFARAAARMELARGNTANDFDVAHRLMERLNAALVKLVGPSGFDVLLDRALVLARRAHPVLKGVTTASGGALAGPADTSLSAVELQEGAIAILAQFIELLAQLIGEDLAMRLVRDVWPAAAAESEEQP